MQFTKLERHHVASQFTPRGVRRREFKQGKTTLKLAAAVVALRSIPQKQGKTMVFLVLPTTAPPDVSV